MKAMTETAAVPQAPPVLGWAMERVEGFMVHAWTEFGSGRVLMTGRALDGRSFAVVDDTWAPALYVPASDLERARDTAAAQGYDATAGNQRMVLPDGRPCAELRTPERGRKALASALRSARIDVWGDDDKAADQYLAELGVKAGVVVEGESRPGRRVDLTFLKPAVSPGKDGCSAPLRWLSLDLETARDGRIIACALAMDERRASFIDAPGPVAGAIAMNGEQALLAAVRDTLVAWDPDVITGWNVVDFDLRAVARRCAFLGLPFDAGRTDAPLRILESPGLRTLAILEGRRCVDAMKVMRSAKDRYGDQRLETVARAVLGQGKLLDSTGEEKLDELDELLARDPATYAAYCQRDAELPLDILRASGMGELTRLRSSLTGLDLERAWTSVPAFERVYGLALRQRGILPAPPRGGSVGGAPGGLILPPRPGLFGVVLVFDFRSLYPSIIRTFNIDPVAMSRAGPDAIEAPNGARFSRERGVLPDVLDEWAELRRQALEDGDEPRAYALKILQNSFYGVLGSPGCVWADDRLSGAITGFGQELLKATRDWFSEAGYEVLYGDTDSVFVLAGPEAGSGADATRTRACGLAAGACAHLAELVRGRWGVDSKLELRFDKLYARFLIPRLRGDRLQRLRLELERAGARELADTLPEPKGRAKGYAGLLVHEDGSTSLDIKGLEAARGDWSPLARRFQEELLGIAFQHESGDASGHAARDYARSLASSLRSGSLDGELAFRRVLKRNLDRYAADAPHVKAARLAGATERGDVVEYLQTAAGPEPASNPGCRPDYAWYLERQLGPIWESVAEAAGWERDLMRVAGEQGELF